MTPTHCPACGSDQIEHRPSDRPSAVHRFLRRALSRRNVVCLQCGIVLTYLSDFELGKLRERNGLAAKPSAIIDKL